MKRKINIPFLVCLIIFLIAATCGIVYVVSQKNREKVYDKIADEVRRPTSNPSDTSAPDPTNTLPPADTDAPTPTKVPVDVPIDFEKAWEINKDIYAWITIPGTPIDYPIVMSVDDPEDYYLDHTIERVEGLPGSIYAQQVNSKDFSDRVTVLYGHNMKNGSMFGHLHDYKNPTFADEHEIVYIYTPEHIFTYKVFAIVLYDNRLITGAFDFSSDEGTQAYLDSIRAVNNWKTYFRDVNVTKEDRILTLSTCIGNPAQRYLIQAVLINEE